MPTPGRHKAFQAQIVEYVEAIVWTIVPRAEVKQRHGFTPHEPLDNRQSRQKKRSVFWNELLATNAREFNPRSTA